MATLVIGGVSVKNPVRVEIRITDIYKTDKKNAKGLIIRDRVAVKRTIDVEWGLMTQAEISAILGAIDTVFFTIAYTDPELGATTKTFTVTEKSAPKSLITRSGTTMWDGLSVSFQER